MPIWPKRGTDAMLMLEHDAKSFDSLRAVKDVSLTVPQGAIIGLIGPNGSGKSTLMNVIAGSLQPDAGSILFDGHDITHESAREIYQRGLARSFQDPSLFFRMSVLDNMLLPVKQQRGEQPARAVAPALAATRTRTQPWPRPTWPTPSYAVTTRSPRPTSPAGR
ncbi:MAG: ATP-binding cassette domain-containing protein [Caldilineaceae bacterium]